MRLIKNSSIIRHMLFWIGCGILSYSVFLNFENPADALMRTIQGLFFDIVIAYVNIFFLIPRFLEKKKTIFYVIAAIVLVLTSTLTLYTIQDPLLTKPVFNVPSTGGRRFFFRLFLLFTSILLISTSYKFALDWFHNLQQKMRLKNEQLETELKFLRNQVNPHFLFNTLNNIYTLCYLKDDRAAATVLKLSEMMRYILHECNDAFVPLEKEVIFLKSLIELQKIKLEGEVSITFEQQGIKSNHQIAPLILLTFFENCFKHGDIDINPKGWIKTFIKVEADNWLHFQLENTKRKVKSNQMEKSGVGLSNTKRRLELIYPNNNHSLSVTETEDVYQVDLRLKM